MIYYVDQIETPHAVNDSCEESEDTESEDSMDEVYKIGEESKISEAAHGFGMEITQDDDIENTPNSMKRTYR